MEAHNSQVNKPPTTTDEVAAAVEREQKRLFAAVDALGGGAATVAVTSEGWTAKDVLGHLIHYAGQVAFGLGAELQPPSYVLGVQGRPTGDEWNALAVEHYRDKRLESVRAEFDHMVSALLQQARLRTDEQMNATGAIPWAAEVPLWQFIAGDTYLHWPLHAAAIEEASRHWA